MTLSEIEHKKLSSVVRWIQDKLDPLPSIDLALGTKLASGNQELAGQLLKIMLNSLATEQQLINQAYADNNLMELRELIHKLHGGCCYTGLVKLQAICKIIEQSILLQDTIDLPEQIRSLHQEINFLLGNSGIDRLL